MDNRNPIVFCTDNSRKSLQWLDYAIKSIYKHLGTNQRIVVCSDSKLDKLPNGVEFVDANPLIARLEMDKVSVHTFHDKPITPMMFFRLALPLVPTLKDCDRIVYMDIDTEVVSSEFADIFKIGEGEEFDVGAVQTCSCHPEVAINNINSLKDLGAFADERIPAINRKRMANGIFAASGVLVFRPQCMLSSHGDYEEYLKHAIKRYVAIKFKDNDESVMNLYLNVRIIPWNFNVWNETDHGDGALVRHYVGSAKCYSFSYPPGSPYVPPKNIDIVYTVGNPSNHDDQELRWSLRSIAKYGKSVGRIIVVSPYHRDWLADEVIQIEYQDIPNVGYKHVNILGSVLKVVDTLDLEDEFSVSSDDHFYVKPIDFANQPFMIQKWSVPSKAGSSRSLNTMLWRQSIIDTRDFLLSRELPILDFQMHRNARWHGGLVKEHRNWFDEAMKLRFGPEPHLLMQNIWVNEMRDADIKYRRDIKMKAMQPIPSDNDCISIYDKVFEDELFMEFMAKEFGEKCRYER